MCENMYSKLVDIQFKGLFHPESRVRGRGKHTSPGNQHHGTVYTGWVNDSGFNVLGKVLILRPQIFNLCPQWLFERCKLCHARLAYLCKRDVLIGSYKIRCLHLLYSKYNFT